MKKLLLVVVFAFALLPAASFAQNQDGNNQGQNNNDQGVSSIRATEMGEIGLAAATLLGAIAYFGMRRRTSADKK